jgi:hypothetical protein
MEAIARALIYAAVYIDCRAEDGDELYLDEDVKALEGIASFLRHATEEEEDQLAAAAERALVEERALPHPRPRFLHDYAHWMEEMLGDGWVGNRRIREDGEPAM